MDYSSSYRSKIVVWTVLMIVILVGSRALAAWDVGLVDTSVILNQVDRWSVATEPTPVNTVTRRRIARDAPVVSVANDIVNVDVRSEVVIVPEELTEVQTLVDSGSNSDVIYLNDWQYIDMNQVRNTRLQWTNYLRVEQLGREPYVRDWRVAATAQAWSDYSASIGSISHRRKASDGYYNYNWLVQWFKNKGDELTGSPIVFRNVSRATFSESIWRGMWSCSEADCTDEVIEATRSTWNFFYGERSYNGVHYRALTHPNFGIQGLGLAFSGKKYFLTIHYGTQILE